jgi:seryl-tRNA synthetase
MLDLRAIREDREGLLRALSRRGGGDELAGAVQRLLGADEERRTLVGESDALKARRNAASDQVARLKREGADAGEVIAEMKSVNLRIRELDEQLREREAEIEGFLLGLPNPPLDEVPEGGEERNELLRSWGEPRSFGFTPRPHWELGEELGILDLPAGARVSGSGFPVLRGAGARLQRALIQWMLDLHVSEHGYTEVAVPYLVGRPALVGTGQLPKFEEELYLTAADDLFLIPTAEVPVTNLHREELLDGERLPIAYVAHTPCFRREAGAAGKDTRGLLRVHQFEKVELVRFERPEDSRQALELLTGHAARVLELLELPHRVVRLASGDLGFHSALTLDLEVWSPGVERWLEVSSASLFGDFQARRAGIRYRPAPGEKPSFVHTLNASGVALPRTLVALLENGQQEDGSVLLPRVLHPYLGFERIGG